VPRLLQDVPGQPGPEALAADPLRHRFTVVFDREGYSPDLLQRLKQQRIAALTYHKYPGADWAEDEFQRQPVRLANGQVVEMKLAERGTCLSNRLWLREFRKLTESGHQTAILCTDYRTAMPPLAGAMFARWSQENFFKYGRQHFDLDRLADYATEPIAETVPVVNPAYRRLQAEVRSETGKLRGLRAKFAELTLDSPTEPEKLEALQRKKSALQEAIESQQQELQRAKAARKATPKQIPMGELPEAERFRRLSVDRKHLVDTLKMVAYRAETAMANLLREHLSHPDEARSLLQALYRTEADLLPDPEADTLTVRLHTMANDRSDLAIQDLLDELNQTETLFPRTQLRLIFKMGSS